MGGRDINPDLVRIGLLNAIPLVGVLALGWGIEAVILLYFVETGAKIAHTTVSPMYIDLSELDSETRAEGVANGMSYGIPWLVLVGLAVFLGSLQLEGLESNVWLGTVLTVGGVVGNGIAQDWRRMTSQREFRQTAQFEQRLAVMWGLLVMFLTVPVSLFVSSGPVLVLLVLTKSVVDAWDYALRS